MEDGTYHSSFSQHIFIGTVGWNLEGVQYEIWYKDFIAGKIKPIMSVCYLELEGRVVLP